MRLRNSKNPLSNNFKPDLDVASVDVLDNDNRVLYTLTMNGRELIVSSGEPVALHVDHPAFGCLPATLVLRPVNAEKVSMARG